MQKRNVRAVAVVAAVTLFCTQASGQWTQNKLVQGRTNAASTTVGNRVLVAGGSNASQVTIGGPCWPSGTGLASVEAYDPATGTWSQVGQLSSVGPWLVATTVGSKAVFAGGGLPATASKAVDIYDDSTGQWTYATLSVPRTQMAATSVGSKALFAGGRNSSASDVVDIYDDATGLWTAAKLSFPRFALTATAVGTKAIFAGGRFSSLGTAGSDHVDIFDEATGLWTTATLSDGRTYLTSTTVGSKAFIAGGHGYCNIFLLGTCVMSDRVDVYDASTGLWTTASLSLPRAFLTSSTVGSKAIFAGGDNYYTGSKDVVDIYDDTTGTWTTSALSLARRCLTSSTVGNEAVFIGGADSTNSGTDVVDIYTDPSPFTVFCFAKTTPICGVAPISATGSPSATSTTGFVIEAQPVRGCRAGLLLYSNQPVQPGVSFGGPGNGRLCLSATGLRRAGPIESGGTHPSFCDGKLSIDLNRFHTLNWTATGCTPPPGQTNPAGFLGNMGTTVSAQMWGRDSIATGQVLSDGIRWVVGP